MGDGKDGMVREWREWGDTGKGGWRKGNNGNEKMEKWGDGEDSMSLFSSPGLWMTPNPLSWTGLPGFLEEDERTIFLGPL